MLELTVGEKAVGSGLLARLEREIGFLRELGLGADLKSYQRGNRFFYLCSVSRGDRGKGCDCEGPDLEGAHHEGVGLDVAEIVRSSIAVAVNETILQEIEPLLLFEIIARIRPGYRHEEKARVLKAALQLAQRLGEDAFSERSRVLDRLLDYLAEAPLLQLDGFVRFRLKEYCDELTDCVRQAVDDLEVEKEREELVTLLKDFVDTRPAGAQIVHVLPGEKELFRLVDQGGAPLEAEYLDGFPWELVDDGQVDLDELLITALVSIAPGRVVCHRPIRTGDIPIVADVFIGRLDACAGCELCQGYAGPTARPQ